MGIVALGRVEDVWGMVGVKREEDGCGQSPGKVRGLDGWQEGVEEAVREGAVGGLYGNRTGTEPGLP